MPLPLDHYGLIGDTRTAALIGTHGGVDWLCYPRFDSPSVFAALLDEHKGGRFVIEPVAPAQVSRQRYLSETNVLLTAFQGDAGLLEIVDFMPVPQEARISQDRPLGEGGPPPRLTRIVRATTGEHRVRVRCQPAFDYARAEHALHTEPGRAVFEGPGLTLHLTASVELEAQDGAACAEFTLRAGEEAHFSLGAERATDPDPHLSLDDTLRFWRGWLSQCGYQGRWRNHIHRSALTLKLLTYAPTGAILAAPTTSLPERIGGERNWDYRYSWPRDAAFTVYALLRLGFRAEAKAFNHFILSQPRGGGDGSPLDTLYSITEGGDLTEHTLDHLAGYMDSRPVRIGNGAATQFQLDIYGEFLDAAYLYNKHGEPLAFDDWVQLRHMLDYVCDHWRERDEGIWEVRSGQSQHVLSKVMCWVALDRGLRIAGQRGLPANTDRWQAERDAVLEEVMERGHDGDGHVFTQAYGEEQLDAANLLLPLVKFVGPRDPRWLSTLDQIQAQLSEGPLVWRYRLSADAGDGLTGEEGSFLACAFWMVECLARAGRVEQARDHFEHLLTLEGPLGLLPEEVSRGGLPLGNYPQALSHLALISAAFHLDRALGGHGG